MRRTRSVLLKDITANLAPMLDDPEGGKEGTSATLGLRNLVRYNDIVRGARSSTTCSGFPNLLWELNMQADMEIRWV